jgi:hypothetical protein
MWRRKIVVHEDPIEADQAFDVLTQIFPPNFKVEVFYMATREQRYYHTDTQTSRTLYIKIDGPDIELKLRGKTFREILKKLCPVVVNNLDQKRQDIFTQHLLSFSSSQS